jgi:hypothetical protein
MFPELQCDRGHTSLLIQLLEHLSYYLADTLQRLDVVF